MNHTSAISRTAIPHVAAAIITLMLFLNGCSSVGSYGTYRAAGGSMLPLIGPGDRIFVDQSKDALSNLHDGDVIVFRHKGTVLVKRILAMKGETIGGDHGKIIRNGKQLDEPYLAPAKGKSTEFLTFPARALGTEEIFVAGDNRDISFDSRFVDYDPVYLSDVAGKYTSTYWHAKPPAK